MIPNVELLEGDDLTGQPHGLRQRAAQACEVGWRQVVEHRSLLWTVITSFAIFGLWAIQGAVLARLLGPAARGEYGTIILYPQVLLFIGLIGAQATLARRAAQPAADPAPLRSAAIRYGLFSGLLTVGVVGVLSLIGLRPDQRYLIPLCLVCALILPFEHVRLGHLAVDQGQRLFWRYNVSRFAAALVFPLLLFGMWMLNIHSLAVVAAGTVVAAFVGMSLQVGSAPLQLLGSQGPPIRQLAAEGAPYALGIAVGNVFGRLDSLLMMWLFDHHSLGLYNAAVPTATLLTVAATALEVFAFNRAARSDALPAGRQALRSLTAIVALQLFTLAAFWIMLRPLIVLVYGNDFEPAVALTRVLLAAAALSGISIVVEGFLRGRGRPHQITFAAGLGSLVMIGFSLIAYQRLGPIAVPWAAVAAKATCLAWLVGAAALEWKEPALAHTVRRSASLAELAKR